MGKKHCGKKRNACYEQTRKNLVLFRKVLRYHRNTNRMCPDFKTKNETRYGVKMHNYHTISRFNNLNQKSLLKKTLREKEEMLMTRLFFDDISHHLNQYYLLSAKIFFRLDPGSQILLLAEVENPLSLFQTSPCFNPFPHNDTF